MKKKILIFGASGVLGSNLSFFLKKDFEIFFNYNKQKLFCSNVKYVNIANAQKINSKKISSFLILNKIDFVINCVANTNIDYCEKFPNKTKQINQIFPSVIAKICKETKVRFIHISTDHLYSNNQKIIKNEIFKKNPLNQYGKQKSNAESLVQINNSNSLILRTNFFGYSNKKKQFIDLVLNNIENNTEINAFDDYFFTTISTEEFSKIIKKFLKNQYKGIFNIVSNEVISKYEFVQKICKILNIKNDLVKNMTIKNNRTIKKRCHYLCLSNEKLIKKLGVRLPNIETQLKNYFNKKNFIEKELFTKIPYGKHHISKKDINSVVNTLSGQSLTQGQMIEKTEKKISDYLGVKYAVLTSSATTGLHLAYKALGLDHKTRLLTTPISFVSTTNASLYCGSRPIFCDIELKNISMPFENVQKKIKLNSKIKILAPVHMSGLALNMEEYNSIKKKYMVSIVEDAAHAFGSKYQCGSMVGSCKYSDAAVFSFHPVKIIASGEGGVVTTNNKYIFEKILSLRSHGIIKNQKVINKVQGFTKNSKNVWYYEMSELGYHYRQTDIHASLLNSQIDNIDNFLKKRKLICKLYDLEFQNIKGINLIQNHFRNLSSNHLYILHLDFNFLGISRNYLMKRLRDFNIITQVHYMPIPMHPYYRNLGYDIQNTPISLNYYQGCLSLPIFYDLTLSQQMYVIESIKKILKIN